MKTQAIVVATVMWVLSHYANAGGMCSSRDGTQYCTCEYDKRCVSSENGCNCVAGEARPLPPPTAKRLLSTEDYTGSLRVLDTALGSLN
jgi:hypothetical protein